MRRGERVMLGVVLCLLLAGTSFGQETAYPVWTWGNNQYGALRRQTQTPEYNAAAHVPDLEAVEIAATWKHGVALKADHTVWCWGDNADGNLGNNNAPTDSITPVQVVYLDESQVEHNLTGIVRIAAGSSSSSHTLAITEGGAVWVWGGNGSGQLGNGMCYQDEPAAVRVRQWAQPLNPPTYLTGIEHIAVGRALSVAVTHYDSVTGGGHVYTWGSDTYEGLGSDQDLNETRTGNHKYYADRVLAPSGIGHLSSIVAVSASDHVLAIKADKTLWAWGSNRSGQIGDGVRMQNGDADRGLPVQVLGPVGTATLENVVAIAAGTLHSLAVTEDPVTFERAVYAWGRNDSGQLGTGNTTDSYRPVRVLSPDGQGYLGGIVAVAAGHSFSLALAQDGTVYGWGLNGDDATIGDELDHSYWCLPRPVARIGGATRIAVGNYNSIAIVQLGIHGVSLTWDWVYQNTPVSTQDQNHTQVTIDACDMYGSQNYDAAWSAVMDGSLQPATGMLFPEIAPGSGLAWNIFGGRRTESLPDYPGAIPGTYHVSVCITGQESGASCYVRFPVELRMLGDVVYDGLVNGSDKLEINKCLNGLQLGEGITTHHCNLSGDLTGQGEELVNSVDKLIINQILNGIEVP